MAPTGVAAPWSRNLFGGEDCLSEASSAAQANGTGAKAPEGPRPGAHGFGSFCRNKRAASCGGETPQPPPPQIQTPQVSILITKQGILRAIGKRDTDANPREGGDERTPRRWHEHRTRPPRPQPQRRLRQAVTRAGTRRRATGQRAHAKRSNTQHGPAGRSKRTGDRRRAQGRREKDGAVGATGTRCAPRESQS